MIHKTFPELEQIVTKGHVSILQYAGKRYSRKKTEQLALRGQRYVAVMLEKKIEEKYYLDQILESEGHFTELMTNMCLPYIDAHVFVNRWLALNSVALSFIQKENPETIPVIEVKFNVVKVFEDIFQQAKEDFETLTKEWPHIAQAILLDPMLTGMQKYVLAAYLKGWMDAGKQPPEFLTTEIWQQIKFGRFL